MIDTSGTLWPALILFTALINSICAMVIHSDMSHLTLAIPSALLVIGGIPLITPYRPGSHAVWHVFTLAACIAYYIITWQRLT
jgi:predicted membrane channel-forming protein YqfA (hemolysin III family)